MEVILTVFLSIFICYGITNIIVNGAIFDDIKTWILKLINNLEESLSFSFENGLPDEKLFLNKKKAKKIINHIENATEELNVNENDAVAKIQNYRIDLETLFFEEKDAKKRKLFIYNKLNKLINCMMCSGFWIGLFLTTIVYFMNINLFGMQMVLISKNVSVLSWICSAFLLSCMFSGTSWLIGVISTYLGDGETPSRIVHKYDYKDE